MIAAIADTHAILWYLYTDKRLSKIAETFIDDAIANDQDIGISSMTLIEIVYLVDKGTVPTDSLARIVAALIEPDSGLTEVALNHTLLPSFQSISRTAIPDMPDRIIAATALHLSVPLISRDGKITVSGVPTIW